MSERLTLNGGVCAMASTDYCESQEDCYLCGHGKKMRLKLAEYEAAERERAQSVWTPCADGLPEAQDANKVKSPLDYKKYLVTFSYGGRKFVRTVTYLKGHIGIPPMEYDGWCETDNGTWCGAREFITAWQPLPAPYNPDTAKED